MLQVFKDCKENTPDVFAWPSGICVGLSVCCLDGFRFMPCPLSPLPTDARLSSALKELISYLLILSETYKTFYMETFGLDQTTFQRGFECFKSSHVKFLDNKNSVVDDMEACFTCFGSFLSFEDYYTLASRRRAGDGSGQGSNLGP